VCLEISQQEFNSWNSGTGFNNASVMTNRIYTHFQDVFDIIFFVSNNSETPSGLYSGRQITAQNDIDGIGRGFFDTTGDYGSNGKLQSIIHLTKKRGLVDGHGLHEILFIRISFIEVNKSLIIFLNFHLLTSWKELITGKTARSIPTK